MPKSKWINRPPGFRGKNDWNRDGKIDGYDRMLDNMAIREFKKEQAEKRKTYVSPKTYVPPKTDWSQENNTSDSSEGSGSVIVALIVSILGIILGGFIAVSILKGTDMIPMFTFIAFLAIVFITWFVAFAIWAVFDEILRNSSL